LYSKRLNEKIHSYRNIKPFQERTGIRQEAVAPELVADGSQKKISQLEQKEEVEEKLRRQAGEILRIHQEVMSK
jgi:hypothetical protein